MRVFPRFKFLSRAVVHQENEGEHDLVLERNKYPIVTEGNLCTTLTVWKKSLLMNCKGFTVIDSDGNLVYRVDNYSLHPHEVILMDASGNSLLTMRRHRVSLPPSSFFSIAFSLNYFIQYMFIIIHPLFHNLHSSLGDILLQFIHI